MKWTKNKLTCILLACIKYMVLITSFYEKWQNF